MTKFEDLFVHWFGVSCRVGSDLLMLLDYYDPGILRKIWQSGFPAQEL